MQKSSFAQTLSVLIPALLGIAALLLYGGMAVLLVFVHVPSDNKDIIAGAMNLIGGSLVGCSFGYFFGSSASLLPREPRTPPETPPA